MVERAFTARSPSATVDIEDKVAFLRQASAYPDHPHAVEVVETHMSWVFLTDRLVYKMKKPVRYDFLDFSTLQRRRHDCEEEVRLNRRLAADIYLGVVPLTRERDNRLALAGNGEPVEWLVKMVRLPADRMLDRMIEAHTAGDAEVERFAGILADFYKRAAPVPMSGESYRQRFEEAIHTHHQQLRAQGYELAAAETVSAGLLAFLARKPQLLDARARQQRIVEAHGDLRPEHVCLIEPPVFIDCLEFNRAFRLLDPADELAFLAMECERAGAAFIADVLFETYTRTVGDRPEPLLVCFYKAFRAQLRAALSIAHIGDHPRGPPSKWIEQTAAYLRLALEYLGRCRMVG